MTLWMKSSRIAAEEHDVFLRGDLFLDMVKEGNDEESSVCGRCRDVSVCGVGRLFDDGSEQAASA